MTKKKIEIVIARSKWRTGFYNGNSTGKGEVNLLNKEGYKCCLGFIASEFRPSNKRIKGICTPSECNFSIPDLNKYYEKNEDEGDPAGFYDSDLTNNAIEINDDSDTTQKQKEVALKKLFKDSCYKLKFVD